MITREREATQASGLLAIVTIMSYNKERKARLEEEAREWEKYQAEHGYEEGYTYDEYGQPLPAYPPEAEGYYEGDEYYDDRYGY